MGICRNGMTRVQFNSHRFRASAAALTILLHSSRTPWLVWLREKMTGWIGRLWPMSLQPKNSTRRTELVFRISTHQTLLGMLPVSPLSSFLTHLILFSPTLHQNMVIRGNFGYKSKKYELRIEFWGEIQSRQSSSVSVEESDWVMPLFLKIMASIKHALMVPGLWSKPILHPLLVLCVPLIPSSSSPIS